MGIGEGKGFLGFVCVLWFFGYEFIDVFVSNIILLYNRYFLEDRIGLV